MKFVSSHDKADKNDKGNGNSKFKIQNSKFTFIDTMKAIILCAGYGTRLYPLTKDTAKSLLPVRGKPIVEFIVDKLQTLESVDEIYIVTNHRYFGQFKNWHEGYTSEIPLTIIDDGTTNHKDRLGSIGDLKLAIEKQKINDDLLVIGGDNLFSFPFDDFLDFSSKIPEHTLVGVYNLNGRIKANKYGVVTLNDSKEIIDFVEKPKKANGSHLISMCLYYFPKEKLSLLDDFVNGENGCDKFGNYIQWLIKQDKVYGHVCEGEWFDVGDIDSYTEAICTF